MCQDIVKEYIAARTKSVTEELIMLAWRRLGIRPLNLEVFTEEDFAPSYALSTNPPLPVLFTALSASDGLGSPNSPSPPSSGEGENVDHYERPGKSGAEGTVATGLNKAYGS